MRSLERRRRGRGRGRGRRRAPARLHVGHDRQAEGRGADATPTASGRTSPSTSSTDLRDTDVVAPGAAAVPRRRLERAAAPRLVEGRDGRARAVVRRRPRAAADRGARRHDDDGSPGDLHVHGAGSALRAVPTSRACGLPSSAARRCPSPCSRRGATGASEIVQGYGLTEAAPNVLCLPPEDAMRKLGFAGRPYPHVDVALRDPETGDPARGSRDRRARRPRGRTSSPATGAIPRRPPPRSPTAGCSPATSPSATREGYYRIVDRIKDMVISGGENVYPAEIEAVLHTHPAVAEAAVVGVPDERVGRGMPRVRRPRAGQRRRPRRSSSATAGSSLARFKVPRGGPLPGGVAPVGDEQGGEGRICARCGTREEAR